MGKMNKKGSFQIDYYYSFHPSLFCRRWLKLRLKPGHLAGNNNF